MSVCLPARPLTVSPLRWHGALLGLCLTALCPAACNKPTAPTVPTAPTAPLPPVPIAPSAAASPPASPASQSEDCTAATRLTPGVPGSPGHLIASARNPNGQSELAALMRGMEATLKAARTQLAEPGTSRPPIGPFLPQFRRIRCSWPTNPADRDAEFDALAQGYLSAVSVLDAAPDRGSAAKAYDGVLAGCRSCHERTCGGALAAINALRLP